VNATANLARGSMNLNESKALENGTGSVVKYISRYLGRPVIATSRIDSYDGKNTKSNLSWEAL